MAEQEVGGADDDEQPHDAVGEHPRHVGPEEASEKALSPSPP
ncbi:hypothetical protein ACFQL4_11890 [Halosimplex aquaticum]